MFSSLVLHASLYQQGSFVYTVGSPQTKIISLLPAHTNNRIIVETMGDGNNIQPVVHYKLTHYAKQVYLARRASRTALIIHLPVKNTVKPIKIFTIVNVGYFSFINIKRGTVTRRGILFKSPITSSSVCTHGEGTALYKHKTWASCLFFFIGYLVSTHIFVIVIPAGNIRGFVFLLAE